MKRVASVGIMMVALALAAGNTWAKLPAAPMNDEQKAKAEETKAKAAAAAKKGAEDLAKAQDRAVANYNRNHGKAAKSKK